MGRPSWLGPGQQAGLMSFFATMATSEIVAPAYGVPQITAKAGLHLDLSFS